MTEAQREALAGFLGTEVRQQPGPPNAPQVPLNGNPFPSIDLGDRDWWRGILTGIVIGYGGSVVWPLNPPPP